MSTKSSWWNKIVEFIKKLFGKDDTQPDSNDWKTELKKTESDNNFSNSAEITHKLTLSKLTHDNVYFSSDKRNWEVKGDLDGEAHLFIWKDNKWQGGKYDHVRPSSTSRDFKNVYGGYGCFSKLQPIIGDKVAFILISYNKKYRTNAVFSNWK